MDDACDVLAAYDLGDVLSLAPMPGQHQGRLRIVHAASGRFLAKTLTSRLASPPAVELRHAFVAHLASHGLRVPRFLMTRTGEAVARTAGQAIELQEFVEGRPLQAADPADAPLAGETLAALHRAGSDFRLPSSAAGRDALALDDVLAQLRRLEQQMQTYLPAPEVLALVETVRGALVAATRALADADLPRGMVHGDFRPPNLLRDDRGAVWVTSFDACRWAPLLLDVADLVCGFGHEALSAYEQCRPLTESEARLAPAARRMVLVRSGLTAGAGIEWIAQRLAGETDP